MNRRCYTVPGVLSLMNDSIASKTPFYYGWIILIISALAIFISGPGQTYSISIFVDPIIADTGWSRTMVSGLYTAGSLTAGTAMIFIGRLLDRYGARVMMVSVGLLFGFAAIWMSTVAHPLELYIGFTFLRALGQGSLTLIPITLIALWFVRLRGRASAIGTLGSAASGAAFPILIHKLIASHGWRNTWLILAFIIWGVLLLPAALLIRRSPEAVRLPPDGKPITKRSQVDSRNTDISPEFNLSLEEALRTRTFWLLMFACSAPSLISTALMFHQVSLLASKGISSAIAASVFGIIAPAQILGIFTAGFLTDRFSNRHLLALGQGFLALTVLWIFLISSTWQAFFYGAMVGISNGFIMTTNTVIWPNYYGRLHLGSIRGAAIAGMVFFAALGPLPFGWIFDLTGSYSLAILIFLALPVACAISALLAYPPHRT